MCGLHIESSSSVSFLFCFSAEISSIVENLTLEKWRHFDEKIKKDTLERVGTYDPKYCAKFSGPSSKQLAGRTDPKKYCSSPEGYLCGGRGDASEFYITLLSRWNGF